MTDALVQLLVSLIAVFGALEAVRLSHALEVAKQRRRLLFGIEKELGDFRRELERWHDRAQNGSWAMGGPHRPGQLRCTERYDFEISELDRSVGEALERVDVKLAIVREWEQPAFAAYHEARMTGTEDAQDFAASWDQFKKHITYIINDIQAAERVVGTALRMERRAWWRKLFRQPPAIEKPSGYSLR